MATRTVRFEGGERAWRHARLALLTDLALLLPALIALATGAFSRGLPSLWGVIFLVLLAWMVLRLGTRRRAGPEDYATALLGGVGVLTGLLAISELSGDLSAYFYPAVLGCLAVLAALQGPWVALGLATALTLFETCLWAVAGTRSLQDALTNLELIALFTALPVCVEVFAGRRRRRAAQKGSTRLPAPARPAAVHDSAPSLLAASESGLVDATLDLVRVSSGAGAVSLLLVETTGGERNRLVVAASTATSQIGSSMDAGLGLPGSVLRARQAVVANRLRQEFPGTLHSPDGRAPRHVMAAPVLKRESPIGVMVAQRWEGDLFSGHDLECLKGGARLLEHSLLAQRNLERVTDAHYELESFFEASHRLNSALSPAEVYRSVTEALDMIDRFEFSAIAWTEEHGPVPTLVHASSHALQALVGGPIDGERSLAAMVVKNGHYLPLGGEYRRARTPVFRADEELGQTRSVVVLPLRIHDTTKGTLAVGSAVEGGFSDRRRGMLEVIANQLAVSLSNALTYARVQALATTDALTELFNRRTFGERLDEAIARAERGGSQVTLVMLDIDHFKSINDTHGHPCGDQVLRGLAAAIRALLRRTDTAARYGGEEFALILEDTGLSGALVMAERLRVEAARLSFVGSRGQKFGIRLSLGIATYPLHAAQPVDLIDAADRALYRAKRGGRNQSRVAEAARRGGQGGRISPEEGEGNGTDEADPKISQVCI